MVTLAQNLQHRRLPPRNGIEVADLGKQSVDAMRRREEPRHADRNEDGVGTRLAVSHRVDRILEFADDGEGHAEDAELLRFAVVVVKKFCIEILADHRDLRALREVVLVEKSSM